MNMETEHRKRQTENGNGNGNVTGTGNGNGNGNGKRKRKRTRKTNNGNGNGNGNRNGNGKRKRKRKRKRNLEYVRDMFGIGLGYVSDTVYILEMLLFRFVNSLDYLSIRMEYGNTTFSSRMDLIKQSRHDTATTRLEVAVRAFLHFIQIE